jgi:propanediol dehydratase small subunit
MHKHQYDTDSFWIVFQEREEGGPLVYYFNSHSEAAGFVLGDPEGKVGPLEVARSYLEQAAPLLIAAADVTLAALTAFRNDPTKKDELLAAADFLRAAADYGKLQPNVQDVYRATRRELLQLAHAERPEPVATTVDALREHLLLYKKIV